MDTAACTIILCLRYATTAGQRPTVMNAIGKAGCVALRHPGVAPLDAGVAMIAVARARDMLELCGIARNSPRLSERCAPGAWHLAGQTVHAAVKMIRDTAPSP